jgi:hypothetical protein
MIISVQGNKKFIPFYKNKTNTTIFQTKQQNGHFKKFATTCVRAEAATIFDGRNPMNKPPR